MILKVDPHIHFYTILKPEESDGSCPVIGWPIQNFCMEDLEKGNKVQAAGRVGKQRACGLYCVGRNVFTSALPTILRSSEMLLKTRCPRDDRAGSRGYFVWPLDDESRLELYCRSCLNAQSDGSLRNRYQMRRCRRVVDLSVGHYVLRNV